jgi:hypothetical protein
MNIMIIELATKMVKLAGNTTRDNKKTRIISRHLLLAIRNNKELGKLLVCVTIAHGCVLPNINPRVLPKRDWEKLQLLARLHLRPPNILGLDSLGFACKHILCSMNNACIQYTKLCDSDGLIIKKNYETLTIVRLYPRLPNLPRMLRYMSLYS